LRIGRYRGLPRLTGRGTALIAQADPREFRRRGDVTSIGTVAMTAVLFTEPSELKLPTPTGEGATSSPPGWFVPSTNFG
jgi:hypothetical protein